MRRATISFLLLLTCCSSYAQGSKKDTLATTTRTIDLRQIPANLSTQHYGFFCRQEIRMQQARIPVTFRLGTMEQCDRLEQKPGYR